MSTNAEHSGQPIGVGVIGLGFMGRTHLGAYRAAGRACRIAGVFDRDPDRLTGNAGAAGEEGNIETGAGEPLFDPAAVFATESIGDLLGRDEIEAVSICTPTDTHVDLAVAAVRAGKHVLIEKPVSLDRSAIESLAREAERAGVIAMPAMCMRFWPAWAWLKDRVATGGVLRGVSFERVGTAPGWGDGFYENTDRSGGALYDLHIHDTDFVCHLLGKPDAVTTVGNRSRMTTVYHYPDGPGHVVATGGWLRGGADFRMRYLAEFAEATADFDLQRDPCLKLGVDGAPNGVELPESDGYDGEVCAFLGAIASGSAPPVSLADASDSLAVLEAESRSLETGLREPVSTA